MMGKKQKDVPSLRQRFSAAIALPPLPESNVPQLSLDGDKALVIRQHRGLLEYGENRIRVAASRFDICVNGNALLLRAMDGDDICISGQIFTVEYQYRERTE